MKNEIIVQHLIVDSFLSNDYYIKFYNIDYDMDKIRKCRTCNKEVEKFAGSHSFSQNWLKEDKIFILTNIKNKNGNKIKEIYKNRDIAFNSILNKIYNNTFLDNIYVNSYNFLSPKKVIFSNVFSLYCNQCLDCEHIYNKKEELFKGNKEKYGFSLLRYDLYFEYKYKLLVNNFKYNFKTVGKNIKILEDLIENIENIDILYHISNKLNILKTDINQSSIKNKHSFYMYYIDNENMVEEKYNDLKREIVETIDGLLNDNNRYLKEKIKNINIISKIKEKINYLEKQYDIYKFINEVKDVDEYIPKLLVNYDEEYDLKNIINCYDNYYSPINIDTEYFNKLNIFGFSKIDINDIELLFEAFDINKETDNNEDRHIFIFLTPPNTDYEKHVTIYTPHKYKKQITDLLHAVNIFYKERGFKIKGEVLLFILCLLKNDFFTIYSSKEESLTKMIEIKKFIPDEDSKMNEGIDITEQKMLDFYKKVEDLIK